MKFKYLFYFVSFATILSCGGGGSGDGGPAAQVQTCADLTALGVWYNTQFQETITLNPDCTGTSNFQCPYSFTFTRPVEKADHKTYITTTITQYSQTPGCVIPAKTQEFQIIYQEPNLQLINQQGLSAFYKRQIAQTCAAFPIDIVGAQTVPISSQSLPAGTYDYIGADLYIDRTNYGITERWQVSQQVSPTGIVDTITCSNPQVDPNTSMHGSTIGMYRLYVSPSGQHDLQLQEYFIRRDLGTTEPTWIFGSPGIIGTSDFNTYVSWLAYYTDDYNFFRTGPDTYEYRSLVAYYNDGGLIYINLAVRLKFTPL